jgi:miniconductance mechanosensitive channel
MPVNASRMEFFYSSHLKKLLLEWGFSDRVSGIIVDFSALVIILLISIIIYNILRFIINRFLKRLVLKSTSKWDDHLYEQKVFTRLALLVPAIIIDMFLSPSIEGYPKAIHFIEVVLQVYSAGIIVLVVNSFLNAVYHIYGDMEVAASKPIKGYIQVGKIIVYMIAVIVIVSMLVGQSPLNILAGLGAVSAVLLLIFKDSILGFVAGVQISTNQMLGIGDWITVPKFNVDGVVIDVSLVIVKVRNFDNSIATVPTYAFISESFQNWRDMMSTGGRRMKRNVFIDIDSVVPLTAESMNPLKKFGLPEDVLEAEPSSLTNLGVFRRYLLEFLKKQPDVNLQMSVLVRLLQPTDLGQPLEIVAFSLAPDLAQFEAFQATVFEHIYAVLPEFGLKVTQRVSRNAI